jgi:membrane protein YqaA with SNARE-associated domain
LAHTHPWRLVAVGLVAGAATGAIGWRMGYAVTRMVYLLTARVSDAEPMG